MLGREHINEVQFEAYFCFPYISVHPLNSRKTHNCNDIPNEP